MSSDEEIYEVQEILDERKRGNVTQYLVRWKGYGPSEDSWEPRKNLGNCTEALEVYYKKHATPKPPASPGRSARSTRASAKKVPKSTSKEAKVTAEITQQSASKSLVVQKSEQKTSTLTRSALRQVYTTSEKTSTTPALTRTPLRTRAKLDFDEAKDAISSRLRQSTAKSTVVTSSSSTATTSGSTASRTARRKFLQISASDVPLIILVAILLFIWISLMYQFFYAAKKK